MNTSDMPSSEAAPERLPLAADDGAAPAPAKPAASVAVGSVQVAPSWLWAAVGLTALCVAGLALAWTTQQRVKSLEQELVRRQQSSQDQATEARLMARQAHDAAAEVAAKLALLDARVAESALQRSQVEELIASLSRSRDENVLADVESSLRVAQQQSSITGSAEPLLAALRQAEERLARYNQPRVDRVRRAVARDLDRVRSVALVDLPSLSIRLDEAVRMVDELPLLSAPERRPAPRESVPGRATGAAPVATASSATAPVSTLAWQEVLAQGWGQLSAQVWNEARSLVRVTRIDHPETMLLAPEQGYFLRENLKLRLLNARLSLLSRQFDQAQSDLVLAQQMLERHFDRSSRRVVAAGDLIRQVAGQGRQVVLPRPDDSLAALAAASAGR